MFLISSRGSQIQESLSHQIDLLMPYFWSLMSFLRNLLNIFSSLFFFFSFTFPIWLWFFPLLWFTVKYSFSEADPCLWPASEHPDGSFSALVGSELETVFYSVWSKSIWVVESKHMKIQPFGRIPVKGLNDTYDQFENLRFL